MNTHSPLSDLKTLDRDGAIRETADRAGITPITRRGALLSGGAATAAAALAVVPAGATAATRPRAAKVASSDFAILNFALTLEYLEASFYAEAVNTGALSGKLLTFAETVAGHEQTHVNTIHDFIEVNGGTPVAKPTFNFRGTTAKAAEFAATSLALEATGVGAYLGQSANIKSNTILGEAAEILAVEARHQAWIADLIAKGKKPLPAPLAFYPPLTKTQVLATVAKTGFIVSS